MCVCMCVCHGGFAHVFTFWSLTSKLDRGPLADNGAVHVRSHTGVLSFMLVSNGVVNDQVASVQTVMVVICIQVNFNAVFYPTATKENVQ